MANYIGNFKDKNNNTLIDDDVIKNSSYGMIWCNAPIIYEDGDNSWASHPITFNGEWNWNGNGYLIDDGNGSSISIGAGVSLVEVSGWVTIASSSKNTGVEVHIFKNGYSTGIIGFGSKDINQGTITVAIPPTPLAVEEGNALSLNFYNAAGGNIKLYSDVTRPAIALYVRVIK